MKKFKDYDGKSVEFGKAYNYCRFNLGISKPTSEDLLDELFHDEYVTWNKLMDKWDEMGFDENIMRNKIERYAEENGFELSKKRFNRDSLQSDLVTTLRSKFNATNISNYSKNGAKELKFTVNPKIKELTIYSFIDKQFADKKNIEDLVYGNDDNGNYEISWTELDEVPEIGENEDLKTLFEKYVPGSGKADTIGGEIVRAINRIGHRWNNDGDYFFTGYGLETCGGSMSYLIDKLPEEFGNSIQEQLNNTSDPTNDSYYDRLLDDCYDYIFDYLKDHPSLFTKKNTDNSTNWDTDSVKSMAPEYEIVIDEPSTDLSEKLSDADLIDVHNIFDSWVRDEFEGSGYQEGRDFEANYDGGGLTITSKNKEVIDFVEDMFNNISSKQFDDVIKDYTEDLFHPETGEDLYKLLSALNYFVDGLYYHGEKTENSVREAIQNDCEDEEIQPTERAVEELVEAVMESEDDLDSGNPNNKVY